MFKLIINFLKKVFGIKYERDVKIYMLIVYEINEIFEDFQSLSNDELCNKMYQFREIIVEYLSGINEDIVNI